MMMIMMRMIALLLLPFSNDYEVLGVLLFTNRLYIYWHVHALAFITSHVYHLHVSIHALACMLTCNTFLPIIIAAI